MQPARVFLLSLLLLLLLAAAPASQPAPAPALRDTFSETWTATDALNRTLPGYAECGPPRSGKYVGIFYFLWMQDRRGQQVYDISELLAANPGNPRWGPPSAFHWWGQPHLGYYTSDDDFVIRKHAQMLSDAGVDVVIFDVTNAATYEPTYMEICRVWQQMRLEGNRTPQIAFLLYSSHEKVARQLYDHFYAKNLYPELWFRWKGKPLMMASPDGIPQELRNFFTLRPSWAWTGSKGWFGDGHDKWPWLDNYPQKPGWHDAPDKPEEISVCVAQHPTGNIGRSYHDSHEPPPGSQRSDQGACFAEQWKRALAVNPEFVFIDGWNEWMAQRFIKSAKFGPGALLGKPLKPGDTYFVDTFNQEFSRDIEPMRGGHGDDYYYQMVANIRRFKGVRPAPAVSAVQSIRVDGPFSQWAPVFPAYFDDLFDTTPRNHAGYASTRPYTNATGRNDLEVMKVARDSENLYFYCRTREALTAPAGGNWMLLLLDLGHHPRTGWNGYDILINRARTGTSCTVERSIGGQWKWETAGAARFTVVGNEIQIAVPRRMLGLEPGKGPLSFDFKWADNVPAGGDILEFIDQGDVAPNGRFNYHYGE